MRSPNQLDLLTNIESARAARDAGIEIVTDNNQSWHDKALSMLASLSGSHRQMTGEAMRLWLIDQGLEPPAHVNAWGALTRHACTSGLIVDTGMVTQCATRASHARRAVVWLFS